MTLTLAPPLWRGFFYVANPIPKINAKQHMKPIKPPLLILCSNLSNGAASVGSKSIGFLRAPRRPFTRRLSQKLAITDTVNIGKESN